MPNFRFFNQILVDPIRPSLGRNSKYNFFKTPFWGPFQNWRPDPKVCGKR